MPGSFCNGVTTDQPMVPESRAYCEGMHYRTTGGALAVPITDNPYSSTSRPVEKDAWDRGWTYADGAGGTITDGGCCGLRGVSVPA